MDQIEASGKTVEDALSNALVKLGATRDEVEFVVLDEGKRGLFGRGARDAVVRVERLATPPSAPTGQRLPDTRIPRQRGAGGRSPQDGERGGRPERGRDGRRDRPRTAATLDRPSPTLTADDFAPRQRRPEAGEPPPARRPEAGAPFAPRREPAPRRQPEGPVVEPNIDAEEVDYAAQVVDDILRILDIDASITIREPITPGDGRGSALAVIDLEGDDLGMLIGRRGDTLQALQYMVNIILSHRYPDRGTVSVDVEHYRHRREDQVTALAQRMADRVRRTGSPITLEPMSPAERRLVHLALADDREVETNSIGAGENRKVVISLRA